MRVVWIVAALFIVFGFLLALYFFIQGMTTSAPQQVQYLYFVISALGWVIVVLSFMMTLLTDIVEELRQLNKTALNVLPE